MTSLPPKRVLIPALLVALVAVLVAEGIAAFRGDGSPEAPGSPDETVGPAAGAPLLFVILGDSTGSGVGAVTQDLGYARRCARALAERTGRRVQLRDFAVSGARVTDVLHDQLPRMAGLRPDLVLVVIGGNDVTHLTSPIAVRRDLGSVLDKVAANGAPVIVSGIPALGTATRLLQPLRLITGAIAAFVYDPIWREETARRQMHRVDLADKTGPRFRDDHSLLAPDGFHPGPRGYEVWANTFNEVITQTTS
ncbi:MAG TPA: SGNH/GDSL hydrolase family protein [Candidatus Dormibacteraeota bacterium]|nr:SGNH/GDSL hydrolase family protein [Candidatus Dormibacteraeota bacterium]